MRRGCVGHVGLAGVVAGQGQEHLVQRRLGDGHGLDADPVLAQRDQRLGRLVGVDQRHVEPARLRGQHRLVRQHTMDHGRRLGEVRRVGEPQLQRGRPDRGLELGRRALGDLDATVDDRDPVGELVGLVEVLGGEQDRAAVGDQLADRGPHLAARARVETGGRLVEEDQRRPADQADREVEPAAHATGELGDLPVRGVLQRELGEQDRGALPGLGLGQPEQPAEQHQVLGGGQVLVDRGVLPGDTEQLTHLVRVGPDVDAEDLGVAAVDPQQRRQHREHRGLAGAVRAEHAEDLAAAYLQVDAVDGAVVTEVLDQTGGVHREGGVGVGHGSSVGAAGFTVVSPKRCAPFHEQAGWVA